MNVEITEDVKNELLHRRELKITVKDISATVSRKDLIDNLVSKLGTQKENFVLDKVDQEFGEKKLVCNAKVYENADYVKTYEPEFKLERGKPKEGKKKEEPAQVVEEIKPEEVKQEEKPKEEKPEEAPKEPEKGESK